ncbi:MAG: AraC family transcriptional regulator [Hahellaceae bacterium]|nr:AraC family transcriptional regulator [Hahellaceae bacterium]
MDALTDIMRVLQLQVSIYHNAVVCGDWTIRMPSREATSFHLVTLGECRMRVQGFDERILQAGDLVIFPRDLAHTLEPLVPLQGQQQHLPYDATSDKPGTGLLCGEALFQHRAGYQLMRALPPVFVIPRTVNALWLEPLIALMIAECKQGNAGASVLIDRLSELLLLYALRYFLVSQPQPQGVLALYSHPRLAFAVNALHADPQHAWTLEQMAQCAAQSRTRFASSFREVSGMTPMEYLTWWRMQLAYQALGQGEPVSSVAVKVGYQSESSFIRAFRRMFNLNPGQVRKGLSIL